MIAHECKIIRKVINSHKERCSRVYTHIHRDEDQKSEWLIKVCICECVEKMRLHVAYENNPVAIHSEWKIVFTMSGAVRV